MQFFSQKDQRWGSKKLGTSAATISGFGCALCSVSMHADVSPDEVNETLKNNGGYSNGNMMRWDTAARLYKLVYDTERSKLVSDTGIAETDHYKGSGVDQHFFVIRQDGMILDPLDKPGSTWKKNPYHIVSYRNIYKEKKEDEVTTEDAIRYVYKATQGHDPDDNEMGWARAAVNNDNMDKLCSIRFRDDVIRSIWVASDGTECPDSEKNFWERYQYEHKGHPTDSIARQWYRDHVENRLHPLQAELSELKEQNGAMAMTIDDLNKSADRLSATISKAATENLELTKQVETLKAEIAKIKALKQDEKPLDRLMNQLALAVEELRKKYLGGGK